MTDYVSVYNVFLSSIKCKGDRKRAVRFLASAIKEIFSSSLPTVANEVLTDSQYETLHVRAIAETVPGPDETNKQKKKMIADLLNATVAKTSLELEFVRDPDIFPFSMDADTIYYINTVNAAICDKSTKRVIFEVKATSDDVKIPLEYYDPDAPPSITDAVTGLVTAPALAPGTGTLFNYVILSPGCTSSCRFHGRYHFYFNICGFEEKFDKDKCDDSVDYCRPHMLPVPTGDLIDPTVGPVTSVFKGCRRVCA